MHGLPGDIPRGALVVRLYESLSAQGERGEVPSFSVPAEDPMHDVIRDLNGLCEVWSKHALQWPDTIELCPPEMSAGREIIWYRAFVASGLALQMWARDSRVDLGGRPYRWVHHRIIEAWQKIKKGPGEWRRSDIDDLCHSILYFASTRVVDSSWEWWPIAALSKALRWLDAHPTEPTQHLLARVVEAVPHVELCFIKDFLRIADAASGDLILLRDRKSTRLNSSH